MLHGHSLIGGYYGQGSEPTFRARDPMSGETLEPTYYSATSQEIEDAIGLAADAFLAMQHVPARARAALLYRIALELENIARPLLDRANRESGLPLNRLEGELARTCMQLRFFAANCDRPSYSTPVIQHADPHRLPQPRPDLRAIRHALGPVVIFEASNFPLAFGAAGGDTASALAAGCCVILKAHPLHPGTSEMVGRAIQSAILQSGMPPGLFSLIYDGGYEAAKQLVTHPAIRAVGFTGSQSGGRALLELVRSRPVPIPLYAEMGSINPVFILPHAMNRRGPEIGHAIAQAVTLGIGQFCTRPGAILGIASAGFGGVRESLRAHLETNGPGPMLGINMVRAYNEALARLSRHPSVRITPRLATSTDRVLACLSESDARAFREDATLREEIFGPTTMLVACANPNEMLACADALEGQLTASIWMEANDDPLARELTRRLVHKAGRIVFNGVPTGVEVSPAMVHGGPYPATFDGSSTSVGSFAIERWTRLTCYQNAPHSVLPLELLDENPANAWRQVNGGWEEMG